MSTDCQGGLVCVNGTCSNNLSALVSVPEAGRPTDGSAKPLKDGQSDAPSASDGMSQEAGVPDAGQSPGEAGIADAGSG
jgi:hypothetical protein